MKDNKEGGRLSHLAHYGKLPVIFFNQSGWDGAGVEWEVLPFLGHCQNITSSVFSNTPYQIRRSIIYLG